MSLTRITLVSGSSRGNLSVTLCICHIGTVPLLAQLQRVPVSRSWSNFLVYSVLQLSPFLQGQLRNFHPWVALLAPHLLYGLVIRLPSSNNPRCPLHGVTGLYQTSQISCRIGRTIIGSRSKGNRHNSDCYMHVWLVFFFKDDYSLQSKI